MCVLVEPRHQLGPARPCRARQDQLLSLLRCVEVLTLDFCNTFQGLASAAYDLDLEPKLSLFLIFCIPLPSLHQTKKFY